GSGPVGTRPTICSVAASTIAIVRSPLFSTSRRSGVRCAADSVAPVSAATSKQRHEPTGSLQSCSAFDAISLISPHCLIASLPHCLIASLPHCLIASLPHCPIAPLPHCPIAPFRNRLPPEASMRLIQRLSSALVVMLSTAVVATMSAQNTQAPPSQAPPAKAIDITGQWTSSFDTQI